MPAYKKKPSFIDTEEGKQTKQALIEMASNSQFNTSSSYSANTALHPDNVISFVDKHMEYLHNHPQTNPKHYLANLRLITRQRDNR